MLLLRRYIVLAVLRGVAGTLLVIVSVAACIELVGQLNDVGTGDYDFRDALAFVALRLPRTVFETLPAAALIGSLLSLGNLAVHRELVVMRASGVSPFDMLVAVGMAGVSLAVVMVLLGESLAPSLGAYASELRTRELTENEPAANARATWLRDGDLILSLRRRPGTFGYAGGVLLFELGGPARIERIARADSAEIDASNRWVLANYAETQFTDDAFISRTERVSPQAYSLNPDLLELSVVRQDLLDTPALRRYIAYLQENNLDARRYQIAYWARIANIVSVVLMTVLALPFVFGSLRSAGRGASLLVGLVIGLGYYVIGEMLVSGGEVYDIHPLVVAWAPSTVLLLVAIVAFARIR